MQLKKKTNTFLHIGYKPYLMLKSSGEYLSQFIYFNNDNNSNNIM